MRRPVILDVEIGSDLHVAGRSDQIRHTLQYERVFEIIEDVAGNQEHRLVEALADRIAAAVLAKFDIDEISDQRSALPHMAPPVEKFMSRMRAMGVGAGHQVVIYDGAGIFSAPRVWWLFKLMGQDDVAVLDGGFPKWQAEGRPVESGAPAAVPLVGRGDRAAVREAQ